MIDREQESLPEEITDRFTEPFVQFLKIEAAAGGRFLVSLSGAKACGSMVAVNLQNLLRPASLRSAVE